MNESNSPASTLHKIASGQNLNDVIRLASELDKAGISNQVVKSSQDGQEVWELGLVFSDHDSEKTTAIINDAIKILTHLTKNQDSKTFNQDLWSKASHQKSDISDKINPDALPSLGLKQVFTSTWLSITAKSGRLTQSILLICMVVFGALNFPQTDQITQGLFFFGSTDSAGWQQIWRGFTPVLLHFSFLHLTFNLIWWVELGGKIEIQESNLKLASLLFITAVLSNFAQFLVSGPFFGGLSGVVYGLLAYQFISDLRNQTPLYSLNKNIIYLMLGWLVLGYTGVLTNIIGPVANTAHTAGLLSGALFGLVFPQKNKL